jgi:hypothetical protein
MELVQNLHFSTQLSLKEPCAVEKEVEKIRIKLIR